MTFFVDIFLQIVVSVVIPLRIIKAVYKKTGKVRGIIILPFFLLDGLMRSFTAILFFNTMNGFLEWICDLSVFILPIIALFSVGKVCKKEDDDTTDQQLEQDQTLTPQPVAVASTTPHTQTTKRQETGVDMHNHYIGKTCPYCKTPFVEGDTVVFCSVCDMPHHLECWKDNEGCTTFGCDGTIKEIVGNNSGAATVPATPEPVQTPFVVASHTIATPAPAQEKQEEKSIETLRESNKIVFTSGVPIVLEKTAIIIDRTKDKLFAHCTFRSITDKVINAILIEISCQDIWGSTLGSPFTFQYLDLKTKRGTQFGQTTTIDLPDKTTRKIQVSVKKVLFDDETISEGGGIAFTMPAPVLLREHFGSKELAAEYARETTSEAKFVPEDSGHHWFCTCGTINENFEEKCYHCGCTKKQLTNALDPDALQANMLNFAAEKKAAEEKAKAEQEERIRQAEEEVRLEQERQAEIARKKAEKRAKRKKIITISTISVTSAVCVILAAIILLNTVIIPSIKYNDAIALMDAGKYKEAITAFKAIEGYKDSAIKIKDCEYKAAVALMDAGKYVEAAIAFNALDEYKNSKTQSMALWARITARDAISAGSSHTVGLRSDGTVIAAGSNSHGQCNVSHWPDIVAVSAGDDHTVGLKSDGTVVATKYTRYFYSGQCDVSGWTDIVSISAGSSHTVGLKSDGTVVAVGDNGEGQCNVAGWTNIVSISAGGLQTVGLKADGTVVAVGFNDYGQCDVSGWTDIVAISAGQGYTVGLKSDGTVVSTKYTSIWGDYGQCDVADWTDIVAISAGYDHTIGLKSDGTVVATGRNIHRQCDVSNWTDIVAISAGHGYTVGLKSDGTIVTVGANDTRQCDVSSWSDIKTD